MLQNVFNTALQPYLPNNKFFMFDANILLTI